MADKDEQMSLFEDLLTLLVNDKSITREELVALYRKVQQKNAAVRRPGSAVDARAEARRRAEAEAEAAERARIEAVTTADLPAGYQNAFSAEPRFAAVHADSPGDALLLSLYELGRVDMEFIAHACGQPIKDCIAALKGSVFQNPETWGECFYRGFETAEEYLSGNVIRKLQIAREADRKYNGYFSTNLRALREVIPPQIPAEEIYVTLGSPWLPPDLIDAFVDDLLGSERLRMFGMRSRIYYNSITHEWRVPYVSAYQYNVRATHTYGTERMNAVEIIERTLNLKPLKVYDERHSAATLSGRSRVVNKEETIALAEKQKLILSKFRSWLLDDAARKERVETLYSERFGGVRVRRFRGDFLKFPGMNPEISLYDYQKNAVARILLSPNTLLAHDVGAGKTYIMAAAGMELRRMGISRKNLYAVPNSIIGQWALNFRLLYPAARLLVIPPAEFVPAKRNAALTAMRDGDYDAIIIGYSSLEMIPVSPQYQYDRVQKRIREVLDTERKMRENRSGAATGDQTKLRRVREKLEDRATMLENEIRRGPKGIFFDQLGVDTLFLDEAHNYKNIPIDTKSDNVLGINKTGSPKCQEMMDKVMCVQERGSGRGVVFATGTPITNSVTDLFVMQSYLQREELKRQNLDSFDNWASMFGELATNFEIDVDASGYRLATRFARFHNLPELAAMFAEVADFRKNDRDSGLPFFEGYIDCALKKSPAQAKYIAEIAERAELVRAGKVERKLDNMLKITTDGRKAALDLRLVDPGAELYRSCKAVACAENVSRIYRDHPEVTQLIFCDTSTPKESFNLYDELRRLLCGLNIPDQEIAYIHDATTEKRRDALFAQMNAGEVRVLIGSTFKLGLGVNVQDKLFALHHLDIPWRPSDMVQREGRILRQGNTNAKIEIYRYITDGSFDAYSWQLLETKQRFIAQLLTNSVTERSGSDLDDAVLSYAEVKALAVGNPLIRERVEVSNEISRLKTLRRRQSDNEAELRAAQASLPQKIVLAETEASRIALDAARFERERGTEVSDRRALGGQILAALADNEMRPEERTLMTYRGFSVVLPAHMLKEHTGVYLCGAGRYFVAIGGSDLGAVVRIDNALEHLAEHAAEAADQVQTLKERLKEMEQAATRHTDYDKRIEDLETMLASIDIELGVEKQKNGWGDQPFAKF